MPRQRDAVSSVFRRNMPRNSSVSLGKRGKKRKSRSVYSESVKRRKSNSQKQKFPTNSSKCPWEGSDEEFDKDVQYSDDSLSTTSTGDELPASDYSCNEEEGSESEVEDPPPSTSTDYSQEITSCPWIEFSPEHMPALSLPSGSSDLPIDSDYLFDALEVYETCRCYYRIIQLSPFLFEDFCAALICEENTRLLAEVHISLLRFALRDDEDDQILLSVQDTNNSFNVMLQLIEPMTYAEVLRQYVESDQQRFPVEVLEAASGNYPFVSVRQRLTVLLWLCDRFLQSQEFKSVVKNEGKIVSDDHCRECGKTGDVLLCDGCEACYHLSCANLQLVPDGEWFCQVCIAHELRGVSDIGPNYFEHHRQPLRKSHIGYDRHGRRYWFLARRIIVQDDISRTVVYYSILPQLYRLLSSLVPNDLEKNLAAAMLDILPEISRQMRITMEITNERNLTGTESYLANESVRIMGFILSEPHIGTSRDSADDKFSVVLDDMRTIEISQSIFLTALLECLGFRDGHLNDLFCSRGLSGDEVLRRLMDDEAVSSIGPCKTDKALGFKLGEDMGSKPYVNQYSINELAKKPYIRSKERDKRKYLCGRFSLSEEFALEWSEEISYVGAKIQDAIDKLCRKIPRVLMHRSWRESGLPEFKKFICAAPTIGSLGNALLRLENGIRRPALSSVWWGTLGHTRLMRITGEDRERRLKMEQEKKKAERNLLNADPDEERDVVWVKYVKISCSARHSLWRQKDEHYRVNGRGSLGGWLWISNTRRTGSDHLPAKPTIGLHLSDNYTLQILSIADKKAISLMEILNRIRDRMLIFEDGKMELSWSELLCFSTCCRLAGSKLGTKVGNGHYLQCFSSLCRNSGADRGSNVHAVSSTRNENIDCELGVKKPFPLPLAHSFRVRRTAMQNLLVLPDRVLKRLARQGGLNGLFVVPGFSKSAKSNQQVWNYPCYRPLFDTCWRYMTLHAQSYHAVALQLQVLHACIRWNEMFRDPSEEPNVTIHHPDHDEVRSVIAHKEYPPDGMYERYKLRVQFIQLEDNFECSDDSEKDEDHYRSGRINIRKRKSAKFKSVDPSRLIRSKRTKLDERWIDGVDLKLWEIVEYWRQFEKNNHFTKLSSYPYAAQLPSHNEDPRYLAQRGGNTTRTLQQKRPQMNAVNSYAKFDIGSGEERSRNAQRLIRINAISDRMVQVNSRNLAQTSSSNAAVTRIGGVFGAGKALYLKQPDGSLRRVTLLDSDHRASATGEPERMRQQAQISPQGIGGNHRPVQVLCSTARAGFGVPSRFPGAPNGRIFVIRQPDGSTKCIRQIPTSAKSDGTKTVYRVVKAEGGSPNQKYVIRAANVPSTSACANVQFMPRLSPQSLGNLTVGNLADSSGFVSGSNRIVKRGPAYVAMAHPAGAARFDPALRHSDNRMYANCGDNRLKDSVNNVDSSRLVQPAVQSNLPLMMKTNGVSIKDNNFNRNFVGDEGQSVPLSADYEYTSEDCVSRSSTLSAIGQLNRDCDREVMRFDVTRPSNSSMRSSTSSSRRQPNIEFMKTGASPLQSDSVKLASREDDDLSVCSAGTAMPKLQQQHCDQREQCKKIPNANLKAACEQKLDESMHDLSTKNIRTLPSRSVREATCDLIIRGNMQRPDGVDSIHQMARREIDMSVDRVYKRCILGIGGTSDTAPAMEPLDPSELSFARAGHSKAIKVSVKEFHKDYGTEKVALNSKLGIQDRRSREMSYERIKTLRSAQNTEILSESSDNLNSETIIHDHQCICKETYNRKRFYVSCRKCKRAFHGKCVGVAGKRLKNMKWLCGDCKDTTESGQELYCVCQKPYDNRFYVGCDGCQGWFHPECVGVTQSEVEVVDQYLCPNCSASASSCKYQSDIPLHRRDYSALWNICESLMDHRNSWPFVRRCGSNKGFEKNKIQEGMYLCDIVKKLGEFEYQYLGEFTSDVWKIFTNAKAVHAKGSAVYKCADVLEQLFCQQTLKLKIEVIKGMQRGAV